MLGRRGPAQAAFTSAELRELGRARRRRAARGPPRRRARPRLRSSGSPRRARSPRARTSSCCASSPPRAGWAHPGARAPDRAALPALAGGDPRRRPGRGGRRAAATRSSASDDGTLRARAVDGPVETIEAGLVLRSVGYRAVPLPDVPFDERALRAAQRAPAARSRPTASRCRASTPSAGSSAGRPASSAPTSATPRRRSPASRRICGRARCASRPRTRASASTRCWPSARRAPSRADGWRAIDALERERGRARRAPAREARLARRADRRRGSALVHRLVREVAVGLALLRDLAAIRAMSRAARSLRPGRRPPRCGPRRPSSRPSTRLLRAAARRDLLMGHSDDGHFGADGAANGQRRGISATPCPSPRCDRPGISTCRRPADAHERVEPAWWRARPRRASRTAARRYTAIARATNAAIASANRSAEGAGREAEPGSVGAPAAAGDLRRARPDLDDIAGRLNTQSPPARVRETPGEVPAPARQGSSSSAGRCRHPTPAEERVPAPDIATTPKAAASAAVIGLIAEDDHATPLARR